MTWSCGARGEESEISATDLDERGDTLIEVLIALVILGIAAVALLTGFATAITASSAHRQLATLDSSVRAASDQVIAQVQQQGNNAFGPSNCANGGTSYTPTWNLSGTFKVTSSTVTYWNGSSFVPSASLTSCTGYEAQLWTITIGSGSYSTTVSTVIYDPNPPSPTGGTTPYKLVFLSPTTPGTGTVNAPVSPQPIVAVEDQKGDIVYGDDSSVTLTPSVPGSLSSNCSGVNSGGYVSFSDCSFSGTGTYSLTAVDSNTSLINATGASYVITKAPPAKVVFTSTTMTQTASLNSGALANKMTIQEEDAFGTPDPGALTVSLTSTSSKGFFTLSPGATAAAGVTSVSIPAGQSTVSFYYGDTTAGSPTISAASAGLQTGTQAETINPGAENRLAFTTPPSTVSAGTGFTVAVNVEDQFGNTITTGTGSTDQIQLSLSSSGFAAGTTLLPATNGVATFSGLTINVPGTYTIKATDTSQTSVTSVTSGQFTVTPPPPSQLVFTSTVSGSHPVGTTASVGPFAVKVEDQFGNAVTNTGAPVSLLLQSTSSGTTFFTPTSGGTTGATVTIATGASSSSSFYYADTSAGTPTITATATVNSYVVSGSTKGFTMTPGAEKQMAVTTQPPSSVGAGTSFSVGITVEDQFGNTITTGTGSSDHISLGLSTGSFATGTTTTMAANGGVATFTGLKINTLGPSYTITATDTTDTLLTAVQTNSFAVTAGPPAKLVFTSTVSGNQTVSATATVGPFAVQVQDQFGDPVANTGGAVSLQLSSNSGGTTFFTPTAGGSAGSAVTIASGASTSSSFFYSDTSTGTPTLNASATVNGQAVSGSTNSFTMVAGTASQLDFTSTPTGNQTVSSSASVGPFAVQVQDQFGNPVTNAGATVTLALSSSSAGTSGHTPFFTPTQNGTTSAAVTIANGASTSSNFYYSDTLANAPTINASATVNGSVVGDSTNGFTMVAGTASQLGFTTTVSGNQGVSPTATVGPFAVQVQDQFGNAVTNTGGRSTLTLKSTSAGTTFFTTTSGGSTSSTVSIARNASTSSNFYYSDTSMGTPTIQASATVNGQTVTGSTNGFTMVAGAPSQLAFTTTVSGNQTVSSSAGVGPFAVQVQDQFGNPVTNTGTAVTLGLTTTSAGTSGHTPFFSPTQNGTTGAAVTIANGASSSGNFYYSDTKAGAPTITLAGATVNGSAVTDATTNGFTMVAGAANKLGFTTTVSGNQTVSSSAGVGPFAVQVQDQFGNPVTNTGTAVTLGLTTTSAGTSGHTPFFTPTQNGTTGVAVTIANGASSSGNFYYSDTLVNAPTVTLAGATVNGSAATGTTTNGFTMVAGAANKLAFTSTVSGSHAVGTSAGAGPFAVQVQDQFGNPVTNTGTAVTLGLTTSSAGTSGHTPFFTPTQNGTTGAAVTIANGASSSGNFYYSDTLVNAPTINASATVNGSAAGGSTSGFTMAAGAANKLGFTTTVSGNQTVSSSAGVGPFAVQVQDQFGNPVTNTGTAVTLGLTTSSAGTSGHTPFFTPTQNGTTGAAVTIANGASSSGNFYYSDTKPGAPTITLAGATVNGSAATGTTTSGFTMVAGTANSLSLSAATTTPVAGAGDNLTITALDAYGNTATGYTASHNLTFSGANASPNSTNPTVTNSSGTAVNFASTTAITFTNGVATVSGSSNGVMTLYKVGAASIVVTDGTISNGTGLAVTVTGVAANKLAFTTTVSGNQTVSSSAGVGPFAVQVQDQFGNPVTNTGTAVTLGLTTTSAGTSGHTPFFSPTQNGTTGAAVTIANGASSSGNFYYSDTKAGAPTITLAGATVNGSAVTGATTNGFTMVAGAANKLGFTTTVSGNQTVSSSAGVGPFAVQVQDQFGNPVTNTGTAVTLGLTTTSAGTSGHTPFFTPTQNGTTGVAVTIANGASSSGNFYYSDTLVNAPTVTLAGATVNGSAATGTTTNGFTMVAGAANKLAFTSTVSGSHAVGTSAGVGPFAVQVQDQFGNPVTNTGTAVTLGLTTSSAGTSGHTPFFTPTQNGTTGAAVTIANGASSSGNFYYSDTLVNAPTINASATVNGSAAGGSTSGFTMAAGAANKLGFTTTVSGNQTVSSSAGVGPFAVQVQDQFGNPVTNTGTAVTLGLTTSSAGTSGHTPFFTPTQNGTTGAAVTIANGASSSGNFYYSDTKPGAPTITLAGATVNGSAATGTTTSGFTMVAGTANSLSLSAATTTPVAGAGDNLTITALDAYGNTATGYTASHNLTFSGANASPNSTNPTVTNSSGTAVNFASTTAITFTNGVATVSGSSNGVMTLYKVGAASIVVTDGTISNGTGLAVTVGLANTAGLSLGAATTTPAAGAADNLTVTAVDTYGNTATGYTGSHSLTFGGASAIGTHSPTVTNTTGTAVNFGTATPVTFTNGVATVSGSSNGVMTLYNAGTASITVTDGTINNGTGLAVTVGPAGENKLVVTTPPPTTVISATPFSMTVTIEDQYGNTITTGTTGSNDSIQLALSSGSFSAGGTPVTATGGVATFSGLQINTSGSYTITASDATHSSVTSAPTSFTVIGVTANSVASKTGTTSTTGTTGAFTTVNTNTYVISAFEATSQGSITTPTPTVSGGEATTLVAGSTNNFGGNSSPNCDANRCTEWAWTFTATSSTSQTVTMNFSGTPQYTAIDVLHLSGNNTTTPIVAAATSIASNQSNTATANLAVGATAGDASLEIIASDMNEGNSALTWAPATGVSMAFQNGTANGSLGVYVTVPAVQNESTSTSGWNGNDWGTIALEIGVS